MRTSAALTAACFSCSLCHSAAGTASQLSAGWAFACVLRFPLSVVSAVSAYPHFDKLPLVINSLSDSYRKSKCHSSLQQSCRPITLGLSTALRAALRRQSPSCVQDCRQSHQRPDAQPLMHVWSGDNIIRLRSHAPASASRSHRNTIIRWVRGTKTQLTKVLIIEPTWADKCRDQREGGVSVLLWIPCLGSFGFDRIIMA